MGKLSEMSRGEKLGWAFAQLKEQKQFNREESERLKREGMKQAADNSASLEFAREVAREIATKHRSDAGLSCATADDVGAELERRGYSGNLGPAAGSLFKGKEWEFTGQRIRSARKSNHARELKVWRLK